MFAGQCKAIALVDGFAIGHRLVSGTQCGVGEGTFTCVCEVLPDATSTGPSCSPGLIIGKAKC